MQNTASKKKIVLVGNPNVGKSTVFNRLSNKKQKTGNYAGVTVASHSGSYSFENQEFEIIDLPGAYSIYPGSEDEAIFSKYLTDKTQNISGVVYILEALSIKRGLLLLRQIQDLGLPVLVVLNQIDQAERRGITIDIPKLEELLETKVVATNAKINSGIEKLKKEISENNFRTLENIHFEIPAEQKKYHSQDSAKFYRKKSVQNMDGFGFRYLFGKNRIHPSTA